MSDPNSNSQQVMSPVGKLTKYNYLQWAKFMDLIFQEKGWAKWVSQVRDIEEIKLHIPTPEFERVNVEARLLLVRNVDKIYYSDCQDDYAFQIWERLKQKLLNSSAVSKVDLLGKFLSIKLSSPDKLQDHITEMRDMMFRIQQLNTTMEDLFGMALLKSLSKEYDITVRMIRQNSSMYSFEEVVNQLQNDQDMFSSEDKAPEAAFYTNSNPKHKVLKKCNYCQKVGHLAKDCWKKQKKAQDKHGESEWKQVWMATKTVPNNKGKGNKWYFDSGAFTHVCGNERYFTNLVKDKTLLEGFDGSIKEC